MKLYFHGHNYKYAAEQMLLSPHGICYPAGAPIILSARAKHPQGARRIRKAAEPPTPAQ